MSVYTELKAAGCQLEHHESDLYVKLCPKAITVIRGMEPVSSRVTVFEDNIDGNIWVSIPFAYDPFWENKDA